MQLVLHVSWDAFAGPVLRFPPGKYVFGRADECQVRLLIRAVSRQHFLLTVGPDRAVICDLGSRNHTLLNWRQIADERPLADGDRLFFCGATLRVEVVPDDTPASPEWVVVPKKGQGVTVEPPPDWSRRGPRPLADGSCKVGATLVPGPGPLDLGPGLYTVPLNIPGSDLTISIELRYRLGRGQFGEVWWAKTRGTSVDWHDEALKVSREPDGSEPAYLCRRGAMAVAAVTSHPNVLGPGLVGSFVGRPLVGTEFADNSLADLAAVLPRADLGPRLMTAIRDAAAGLDHLHAHGLVHGCPKPADILFVRGRAAVADFDLVHPANSVEGAAAIVRYGEPGYLAPEVWAGQSSGQSDQYALACGYAELRGGRRVSSAWRRDAWEQFHRSGEPDVGGLSAGEQFVVRRALDKNPDKRFSTCQEFAAALMTAAGAARPVK